MEPIFKILFLLFISPPLFHILYCSFCIRVICRIKNGQSKTNNAESRCSTWYVLWPSVNRKPDILLLLVGGFLTGTGILLDRNKTNAIRYKPEISFSNTYLEKQVRENLISLARWNLLDRKEYPDKLSLLSFPIPTQNFNRSIFQLCWLPGVFFICLADKQYTWPTHIQGAAKFYVTPTNT